MRIRIKATNGNMNSPVDGVVNSVHCEGVFFVASYALPEKGHFVEMYCNDQGREVFTVTTCGTRKAGLWQRMKKAWRVICNS